MPPTRYQISVRGRLTEHLGSAFAGMTLYPRPGETVLLGEIRDQAHLFGILDQVRDLGLDLISVQPAPPGSGSGEARAYPDSDRPR
jgi:hypothetical protein